MNNFDVNRFVAEGIEDEVWTVESFGICPRCGDDLELVLKNGLFCKCTNPQCTYQEYEDNTKNASHPAKYPNLTEYIEWLKKQNISDDTIKTYISGTKKYIQFLNSQGQSPLPLNNKGGKDYTKYIFNDQIAGKSPMFYIVIKYYVEKYPAKTLEDLEQDFPKWICPSHLFKLWAKVTRKEWENNRYRKEPVTLGNGIKIALTTQWTKSSFENFRRRAKKFGLNIEIFKE